MTRRRFILLSLIMVMAMACVQASAEAPKNVILLIGDGMGAAQVTMTRLALEKPLYMDSMPFAALVKSYAANAVVTDSAAAGTALATGYKTNNGMIATLPDGTQVESILEAAARIGKATGLVTTTTITHATPASFGAKVQSRASEADIAPQYLDNNIDVLLGGGRMYFVPKSHEGSKRGDDRDLLAEAKSKGYTVVDSRPGLNLARGDKLLGLFQMSSLTCRTPEPTIAEMTDKAIRTLARNGNGFFLMVEGGQIDWRCHDNDAEGTIKHTQEFDKAVGKALQFARRRGDTLVIVTADHETGGLTINYPDKDSGERFKAAWTTKGHSGTDLPLFAEGPGAIRFSGLLDNTDVPRRIAEVWGIEGFAKK